MSVSVSSVPSTTRKPGVYLEINTAAAKAGLPSTPVRALVLGVMIAAGTADALELVQVFDKSTAKTYFGAGSPLAIMIEEFLEQNPYISELWVCPQAEEAAGVAAVGTLSMAVASLTAGTLTVWIGRRSVRVGIAATDTADLVAAAVEAALDENTDLPFTAAVVGPLVTVTCKAKGTAGNSWVLRTEYTGTGLTVTLVQPATGATDPVVTGALDLAVPETWDILVSQYNDAANLALIKAHLTLVSGPMEQRPGVAIWGITGTLGTNTTLASGVNSGRMAGFYLRGTRSHPMEIAATVAAAIAGESDLARPLNFVALPRLLPPDLSSNRLTRTEQESCLNNGLAPLMVGAGNEVQIVRTITNYVVNAFDAADDTLLDLQTIRVLDYTRYAVRTKVQLECGRAKLADTAVTANTTDPDKIRSVILGVLMLEQTSLGYLENVEEHKDRLVVERDDNVPTRVNASIPADIVDGLHVFAGSIDLILG